MDDEQLEDIQRELIDRFGLLPDPARALLDCHRLRIEAKKLGIIRIDASAEQIQLQFMPNPPIKATRILYLVNNSKIYALSGPDRLRISVKMAALNERIREINKVFAVLAEK